MLLLLALTYAGLKSPSVSMEETQANEQSSYKSLTKIMNNVDTIQAKTATELNKMEKDDFFAIPKAQWQDPGPEAPRYKSKPSSLLEEAAKPTWDQRQEALDTEASHSKVLTTQMDQYMAMNKQHKDQVLAEMKALHAQNVKNKNAQEYASAKLSAELKRPSSFAQTSENPDDGFAKVEAKLKALQEKIKADTAKFEQEAKAAPSSLLQQGERLSVDGLNLQLGTSTLAQEQEGFAALNHKMDNVKKMQAETAKELAAMQKDSFFNPGAHPVAPSSLLQEKVRGIDQATLDKLRGEDTEDQNHLQVEEDKFHDAMSNLASENEGPYRESGRFKDLERKLESMQGLRGAD